MAAISTTTTTAFNSPRGHGRRPVVSLHIARVRSACAVIALTINKRASPSAAAYVPVRSVPAAGPTATASATSRRIRQDIAICASTANACITAGTTTAAVPSAAKGTVSTFTTVPTAIASSA